MKFVQQSALKKSLSFISLLNAMYGKQTNDFILRLLKVFGVVCRLQPVWRGEMIYPHILSVSAASIAQLHTARVGVVWFQRERLLRESKCGAGDEGQGVKTDDFPAQ